MKKINSLLLLILLFLVESASSQTPESIRPKLLGLLPVEVMREHEVYFGSADPNPHSATTIPVIIEVSSPEALLDIEALGGRVNTREGHLATVQLPKKMLAEVAALPDVVSIEYNKVFPQTDLVRQHTRANLVHQSTPPLPQGYTGKGVVVGVIDVGIDFRHPDFRNPADPSKSRILAIWDQVPTNGLPPAGFTYGSLYTKSQIEAELTSNPPNQIDPVDNDYLVPGHGTHVTGIAAGNEGMAPDADLIIVISDLSFNGIIDGVKFIRDYAKNAGKPCVVNLSVGSSISNHEGNTNMSKLIDNLLTGSESFSVVAAAGNFGSDKGHWGGFDMVNDTAMFFTGMGGRMLAYFRVPKIYGESLYFSAGVDSAHFDMNQLAFTGGTQFLGATPWKKVSTLTDHAQFILRPGGDTAALVQIIWQSNLGLNYYPILLDIYDMGYPWLWQDHPEGMDIFRFMFRGTGSFHGWLEGQPFFVVANPDQIGLPSEHFVPSDNQFGILTPADGKNIIAAGAYVNRPEWTDVTGQTHFFQTQQATGELADFSSHGPTFDGRNKPEICAPGKHINAAYPTFWEELSTPIAFLSQNNPYWMFVEDTIHANYSGTSMASPAVAGCIALLLEAKPDLKFNEIRDLLTSTALTDAFTDASGPLPNGLFGYGKIDIFSAVLAALGLSGTENIHSENAFTVFPNPATDMFFVKLNKEKTLPDARLRLLNTQGKVVFEKTGVLNLETVRTGGLPVGVYFLEIMDEGLRTVDKVLIVK